MHLRTAVSVQPAHYSLLMQPPPVNVWLQIITLSLNGSKSSHITSKHKFEQISTSRALSADFDSIWTTVLVWEEGSMVKRITQNSPTRLSLTPCQLFSSIHPSIYRPFFLFLLLPFPMWVVIFVCSFHPYQEDYIVHLSRFTYPSPVFSLELRRLTSKLKNLFSFSSNIPKSFITAQSMRLVQVSFIELKNTYCLSLCNQ